MKRSIRFGLLLSLAEKQALARLAEAEGGVSQGAMVRNLIRREAQQRGLWPFADATGATQAQNTSSKREHA